MDADLELYWIGQMYAVLHCLTRKPSMVIYKKLDLNTMRHFYITGHEMGLESAVEHLAGAFDNKGEHNDKLHEHARTRNKKKSRHRMGKE